MPEDCLRRKTEFARWWLAPDSCGDAAQAALALRETRTVELRLDWLRGGRRNRANDSLARWRVGARLRAGTRRR